jgi:hypothetical protein
MAFLIFGVFSTLLTYNKDEVLARSFVSSSYEYITIGKRYSYTQNTYVDGELDYTKQASLKTMFTQDDYEDVLNTYGDDCLAVFTLDAVSTYGVSGYTYTYSQIVPTNVISSNNAPISINSALISGFAVSTEQSSFRTDKMLFGTYPQAGDEVAISKWYYTMLKNNTLENIQDLATRYSTLSDTVEINSEEDVLGKYLNIMVGSKTYLVKITGIFDSGEIPSEYEGWDDNPEVVANWDEFTYQAYNEYTYETLQRMMLVNEDFYGDFVSSTGYKKNTTTKLVSTESYTYFTEGLTYYYIGANNTKYFTYNQYRVYDATEADVLPIIWLNQSEDTLKDNEVVLDLRTITPTTLIKSLGLSDETNAELAEKWKTEHDGEFTEKSEKYARMAADTTDMKASIYTKIAQTYANLTNISQLDNVMAYLRNDSVTVSGVNEEGVAVNTSVSYGSIFTADEYEQFENLLCDFFNNYYPDLLNMKLTLNATAGVTADRFVEVDVAGFYVTSSSTITKGGLYTSENVFSEVKGASYTTKTTKYVEPDEAIYNEIYVPFDGTQSSYNTLSAAMEVEADDGSFYQIDNLLLGKIDTIDSYISGLRWWMLLAGVVFAIFAGLLLYNFISASIENKTHEIGVLRAVGARGKDVFRIFYSESSFITMLCFIISVILSVVAVNVTNGVIATTLGFSLSLLRFTPTSFFMMLAIAMIVSFLGTFIPVKKVTKRKPIESMKDMI